MRDINFIRLQNFIAFSSRTEKKKRYMLNKLKALETEFEQLKAKNKCPCLSDYSTCLAEDKWELAQREIERLKAREKALGERVLQLEKDKGKLIDENRELKELIESYRNAVEKCRHIPYIGVGYEVCHTVVEYAQKVDGILFSVEGIDYWFKRLDK